VFALFLVKECYMAVMGTKTIMKLKMNDGAKWYGKISTAVFYTVMFVLIFYQNITERTANQLILCCGGCMLLAFIMYAHQYNILLNEKMENKNEVRREYL
jgi:cardiolipin synthase